MEEEWENMSQAENRVQFTSSFCEQSEGTGRKDRGGKNSPGPGRVKVRIHNLTLKAVGGHQRV